MNNSIKIVLICVILMFVLNGCARIDDRAIVTTEEGTAAQIVETSEIITTSSVSANEVKEVYLNREGVGLSKDIVLDRINTIDFEHSSDVFDIESYINKKVIPVYRNALEDTTLYDIVNDGLINGDREIRAEKGYTEEEWDKVINYVRMDNPWLVWYKSEYYYYVDEDTELIQTISPVYYSSLYEDRVVALKDIELNTAPVVVQAKTFDNDIDKIKYIYDYIIYNTDLNEECEYSQSAYSVLVNHEGLCAGYTKAFQYYMQELGIPCVEVIGYDNEGSLHSWIEVCVENDWYMCDVMWDDSYTDYEFDFDYNYFMCNSAMFEYDHTVGEYSECLPEASGSKYTFSNYDYVNGSDNIEFDVFEVKLDKHDMPNGWYRAVCIDNTGIERQIRVSDWTKSYRFYYIPMAKASCYYIYDYAFDNYYMYNIVTKEVQWFNYETGSWEELV